ncbi:MAG: DUF547 domain-containing protein [Planctomycetes bacterium]|nr:DUF547 domain-containing protein [Planctomycetia bacterium]MBI3467187.1 DUF547 domain-containing protein [Planctomycetota bacterium]
MRLTGLRAVMGVALLAGIVCVGIAPCLAGPTVVVGANVPPSSRIPVERIDHRAWTDLLKKYADSAGLVDYASWKDSVEDQRALDAYLAVLSAAKFDRSTPREVQLAFWINAYNAVTIKGILREYPTDSIRNHTAKVFGYNIWQDLLLVVEGNNYSLEQIEHDVLRKMGEPRIHFAIVCASIGCPRLLNEAYMPDKLDDQLTVNAKAFFADRGKFTFDAQRGTIQVSPILKWFAEDFGADLQAQLRMIAPYLPRDAQRIATSPGVRVSYLDYNWGLNDRSKGRSSPRR